MARNQKMSNGMKYPNLTEEKKLWKKGYKRVACLDEAGRGPLAGPVVAAAVVIIKNLKPSTRAELGAGLVPHRNEVSGAGLKIKNLRLRDSKKLSPRQREQFYEAITESSFIKWGIGKVSEKAIDKINIKNAAELAMVKALKNLKLKPDFLIIDGNQIKNSKLKTYNLKLMVKADEKVFSCACASVLAKVRRDRIMMRYRKKYPKYRFDLHKGYPTKLHLRALRKYGSCEIHRKSFGPVLEILKIKNKKSKIHIKN